MAPGKIGSDCDIFRSVFGYVIDAPLNRLPFKLGPCGDERTMVRGDSRAFVKARCLAIRDKDRLRASRLYA